MPRFSLFPSPATLSCTSSRPSRAHFWRRPPSRPRASSRPRPSSHRRPSQLGLALHLVLSLCACFASLALSAPLALAQSPEAQTGSSNTVQSPSGTSVTEPIFQFHSGFWLNLHHFLYLQARLREGELITRNDASKTVGAQPTVASQDASTAPPASPSQTQALGNTGGNAAWESAVDYYAKNMAHRDLLFDGGMVLIKNRLAELESCRDLSGKTNAACVSGLRPEMIAALEAAAPIYRARWWTADDQHNREWIAQVTPYIKRMGASVAAQLTVIYHAGWPTEAIRVDVVSYAGPFGAYTTLDPIYITVSSTDPRNQQLSAFEILFHEASHALSTSVQDAIVKVCHDRDLPIPRDLWHALLFYTTGEVVRRTLARGDASLPPSPTPPPPPALPPSSTLPPSTPTIPPSRTATPPAPYTPYAYRNGLYTRGWESYLRALEAYWQPYLDGKDSFDHAITAVVDAL